MPRVSIVIPAYNHAAYIAESIESVLRQTYTDFEIIVVNDGSPDATAEVLKPYINRKQIIYIKQPNGGQAKARNRGIQACQGEFVALLDDDDCWAHNKLEWQMAQITRDPSIVMVAGGHRPDYATLIKEQFTPLGTGRLATLESVISCNPLISPGQALIRRSALVAIGGFREEIWGADDWDIYLRLCQLGRAELYDRPSLFYRQHPGNASHQMVRLLKNTLKVLYLHLASVPQEERQRLKTAARHWIYRFGLRRIVYDMRQDWSNHKPMSSLQRIPEVFRRLSAVNYDRIVAWRLFRELTARKVDWSC